MGVSFLYPNFLYLFFLLPIFVLIYFFSIYYTKKKSVVFGNFEAMERIFGLELFSKNITSFFISLVILTLLILAVCGMQIGYPGKVGAYSYVLAIDNSISMSAKDVLPSRLDYSKSLAKDILSEIPFGTNVAIIAFSGNAQLISELSPNSVRSSSSVDSINFGEVDGTNIPNLFIVANQQLKNQNKKAIIIISDGQSNVGDTQKSLEYAISNNLTIYAVAVGTESGGDAGFFVSKVEKDSLKALSFNTGGKFFDSFSKNVSKELVSSLDGEVVINTEFYCLIISIILFFINWILSSFNFRFVP